MRPRPLTPSPGRIALAGYCVEVSERRVTPRLEIESPRGVVYRGREPGRWLSTRGVALVMVSPLIAAAMAAAVVLPYFEISPLLPVLTALGLALVASTAVLLERWSSAQPMDRAIDYAWTWLAPRLH